MWSVQVSLFNLNLVCSIFMKVLSNVHQMLVLELPHCKTHHEVEHLLSNAKEKLLESQAPFGEKRLMWEDVKTNLSVYVRRPEVIHSAHAMIDDILKRIS